MLELKVLIVELLTVDALAPSAVAAHEVATLNHEALDDTMKVCTFEANWLPSFAELASAKLSKVLCCLWHSIGEKLQTFRAVYRLLGTSNHLHSQVIQLLDNVQEHTSILMRPAPWPPMVTSKNTTGFPSAKPGIEPTPDMSPARRSTLRARTPLASTSIYYCRAPYIKRSYLVHHHEYQ